LRPELLQASVRGDPMKSKQPRKSADAVSLKKVPRTSFKKPAIGSPAFLGFFPPPGFLGGVVGQLQFSKCFASRIETGIWPCLVRFEQSQVHLGTPG